MRIEAVQSKKSREAFIRFPWKIYKDDPTWCPPLLREERKFINPKVHPFLQHGSAQCFLAYDNDEIVGRILVSEDPISNQQRNEKVACAGMFECVNRVDVAKILFAAAADWAKNRGLNKLRGPINYSTNYPVGLLLGPYNFPQRILLAHNPPYYVDLFNACGFMQAMDLFTWWGEKTDKIDRWRQKVDRLSHLSPVKIRCFDKKNEKRDIALIKELSLTLLESNWHYVKMTDKEFEAFIKEMKLVPPEYILIAEDNGKAVGLSMTVPDFNEIIRPLNGKLFPFGIIKFLMNLKKIKAVRVALIGVASDYRHQAIAERMILQTLHTVREKYGIMGGELGWTFADNEAMVHSIDKISGETKKTFRIYEKNI